MDNVLDWLVSGDPAVAWQAQRDLLDSSEWATTRARVATEGWGAKLVAARSPDGLWAGGLYSPKWTSTFYTMQTLSLLGLPTDDRVGVAGAGLLLDEGVRDDGAVGLWGARTTFDLCVAAMLLRTATSFGFGSDTRVPLMIEHLLRHQLDDGGWNCSSPRAKVRHSSFHTTLSVLEGFTAATPHLPQKLVDSVAIASEAGREFLLRHHLFRSHRTCEVAHPSMVNLVFPYYWRYTALRSLEYFAAVEAKRDERLVDAIDLIASKQRPDGRWNQGSRIPGKTWLVMERGGQPSRMVTLSGLRVQRWWSADRT